MGGHLLLHPFGIVLEELREQLVVLLLCQLESVRQADAAVRQVGFPTGDVMEYSFNVHIGDIIGQQHDFIAMDFIQVLALHVLRADKAGLQQSCDERACSYKRVEDMHILLGHRSVELRLEDVVYGVDDEVHALHGRIDDAQFLHGERKRAFEELFVEVLDDGLLALQIVYTAYICPHRLIELLQHFGIFLESLLLQEVYHALHGAAHGVVVHELVIGKQRIEHRTGNDVLRQHLDGLCRIH